MSGSITGVSSGLVARSRSFSKSLLVFSFAARCAFFIVSMLFFDAATAAAFEVAAAVSAISLVACSMRSVIDGPCR